MASSRAWMPFCVSEAFSRKLRLPDQKPLKSGFGERP
jgi:hypothetical protein